MKQSETVYSLTENFNSYLTNFPDGIMKSYIKYRILDQIDWYNKKSTKNQSQFKLCMLISIILSALIPILTLLSDTVCPIVIRLLITAISSSITALSAVISLYHFQELWIQYRTNCEILQSTLHRFFTQTGEFKECNNDKAFNLLVMLCEECMTDEFQTWVASNSHHSDNKSSSVSSTSS